MTSSTERQAYAPARTSLAIDNLRAVVILLVLAFHSVLAYLDFLPRQPFGFDTAPFMWRSFPIVDSERWLGFDLFCAWLDVFLMSFFFLISGLFVWPSLMRKGARVFVSDRVLRLGLPFAAVVFLLMPVALYPSYVQSIGEPGLAAYWRHWRDLPFWPSGPVWFLWLLLIGDLTAAGLYQVMGPWRQKMVLLSSYASEHPARFLAGFAVLSALVYIPRALLFGSSAWTQAGPFAFQMSRPLHYALYFLGGAAIGACGIERGLFAPDGVLARHWRRWLVAALASFAAWIGLTALTLDQGEGAPAALQALDGLSFVAACFANCFFVLAAAVQFGRKRVHLFDALKANAYGMYLVHYLFIVWLQYALLRADGLPAVVKAAVVFGGTLALSWGVVMLLRRLPAAAQILGGAAAPAHRPQGFAR